MKKHRLLIVAASLMAVEACQSNIPSSVNNQSKPPQSSTSNIALQPSKQLVYYCDHVEQNMPWMGTGDYDYCNIGPIPTPAPTPTPFNVSVAIEDQPAVDAGGGQLRPKVNSFVPKFKVTMPGSSDEYYGKDSVSISFEARPDGVTPVMDVEMASYDATSNSWTYQVPFDDNTILYYGDQSATITVSKKNGSISTQTVYFSVGETNTFSGFPTEDTPRPAYRLLVDEPAFSQPSRSPVQETQEILRDLRTVQPADKNYSVQLKMMEEAIEDRLPLAIQEGLKNGTLKEIRVATPLIQRLIGFTKRVPPGYAFRIFGPVAKIAGGPITAAVSIVFLGNEYMDPRGFIVRDGDTIDTGEFGNIRILAEQYDNFERTYGKQSPYSNLQLTSDILVESVAALVQRRRYKGEFELWQSLRNKTDELIVFRSKGILFHEMLTASSKTGVMDAFKFEIPGIGGNNTWWPANATFPVRQWGGTAKRVMQYTPDFVYKGHVNDSRGEIIDGVSNSFGNNFVPKYPRYIIGEIDDKINKPYKPVENKLDFRTESGLERISGAERIGRRVIASPALSWKQSVLDSHYDKHVLELQEFLNSDGSPYSKDQYANEAVNFLRGAPDSTYQTRFDGAILMKRGPNYRGYFGVWSNGNDNDGGIRTYFRPDDVSRTFSLWQTTNVSQ